MRPTWEAFSSLVGQTSRVSEWFRSGESQLNFLTGAKVFSRPSQFGVSILLGQGTLSRDPSILLWHVVPRPQETQQTNLLTCHLGARMAPWSLCHWELNDSHLEEVFNNTRV